ncbi:MAG: hypothetical protein J7J92_02080 [Candidatus Aenigmarchaeota archaeon]|nr:hypothetical protein [Candidatus Aenigmarchaeota archaeon]
MYQLVKVESVKKIGGKSSIYTFNYGSNLDGEEVVKNIDGLSANYKKATASGLTREIRSRWNVIPDENGLVKGTVTDISDIGGDWNKMTEFLKKEGAPDGAYNLYRFTKTEDGWKVEKASGPRGKIDKWVETDELKGVNFDIEGVKEGDQVLLFKMNPDGSRIAAEFRSDAVDYYSKCISQMKKVGYTEDDILNEFMKSNFMGVNGDIKFSKLVDDDGKIAYAFFGTKATEGDYYYVYIYKDGKIELKDKWTRGGIRNLQNDGYKFSGTSLKGYAVKETGKVKWYDGAKVDSELEEGFVGFDDADINKKFFPAETVFSSDELKIERAFFTEINGKPFIVSDEAITDTVTGEVYKFIDGKATLDGGDLIVENVDGKLKLNFVGELKVETEVNGVLGINKYGQESLQNFYQKALNSFVEEQGLIFTKEGKIAYIKYLETEGATDMAGGKILEDVKAIIKNYEDVGFKYFGNFHVHFYQEKPSALDWMSKCAEVQSGLEKPYINILYIDKETKEPTLYIYKMNMGEQRKVSEAVRYAQEEVGDPARAIAPESSFEKVNEVSPTNGECKILSDNPISVKISYKGRSDLFTYSPEEFKAKFGVEPPGIDQVKNMKLNDVFGIQTPKEVSVIRTDDKIVFFKDGKEGIYIKPSKEVRWVEPSEPGKIKLDGGKIIDLTDSSNPKVIEPIKPVTEPKPISEPITGVSDQKPFFEGWGDKFNQFSGKMKRGISYLFSGTKSIAGKGKAVGGSIANKINLETLRGNQLKEMAAALGISPFAKGEIKPFTYKTEITIGDTKYKLTFYPKKGELTLYDNVKITGNVEIDGKATKFEIYGDKIKLSNDIKDLSEIGNLNEYKFSDVQIHLGDDGVINLNNGKFSDLWKELRKPGKRIWKTPSDMAESISLKKLKNLKKYIGKSAGSDALTSLTPYFDKLKSAIKSGNTGSAAKILSSIYNKLLNMPLKVSGGAERFAGVSVSGASKLFSIKTRLNSIFSYVKKMNTLSKQSSSFEVATDLFSKEKVLSNELKLKSSLVTYGLEDKSIKIEFTGTGAVGDIDYKLTIKDGQVRIVGKSGIGTITFEGSTDEIKLPENKFIIGNDEISVKKISNVEINGKSIDVTTDNPAKLFDELGDIYGKDISKVLKESGLEDTALKITFTGADGTKYKLSISDGQVVIRHKGLYGTETWTESADNVRITKNKLIIGDEEISIDKITNVEAGDSLRNTKPVAVEENDNLEGAVKKLQADYGLPASETKIPTDDKIIFWSRNQFWNNKGEFVDDTKMLYVDENGNLIYKYMDNGVVKTEIAQSVKMDYDGVKIKINGEWISLKDVKTLNINGVKYSVKDKVIGIISPIDGGGEVIIPTSIKELKSAGNSVEAVFDSEEFFSGISGTMKKTLHLASHVEMTKLSSGDVIVDFKGSNVIDADKMILTGAAESENLEAYAKKITSSLEGSGVLRPRIELSPDNIQSAVKAYEANDISKFENTDFGKLFKSNSEAYLLLNDNDIIKVAKDDGGLKLLDSDGKFLGNLFVDDEGLKIIKENEVFDLSKLIGGADLKTIKAFSEGTGLGTKFVKNFGPGDFTTMALFAFMAKWSASGVGGDYQKRYFLRQAAYEIPELIPENLAAALAGTNLAVLPVVACEIYIEEVADQVILQNDFKKLTGHDYSELIYEHNPVTEVGKRIKRFVWEPETNNLNDEFTQTVSEILSAKAQSWTKDKINEECLSGKDITVDDIYNDILSHAYGYSGFDFDEITDYISSDEFKSKFNLGDGEIWAKDKIVEIKEPVNLEGIFGDNIINNFVSGMVTPVASLFDRGEETTTVGENLAKSRYALGIDTSLVSSSSGDEENVQNLLVFAIGDNPDKIWSKYKDEVDKMWSEYGTTKYYDKDAKGEYWEITIDKETGKIIGMDKYEFTVDLPQYNPTSIESKFGQGLTPKIGKPKIKHVSYYGSIFQLADEENKKLADTLNDFMFYGLGDYITSLNTREDVDNVLKEFKDSEQYKSFVENHKDILTTMFGEPDVPDSYIVDQMLEQTKIKLECEALGAGEIIFSDEKIAEALKKADKNNNGLLDADEEEEFKSVLADSIGQRFTYSFREGYHSLLNTIATFARGSKYHENLKKNQRFGWITDEWENSEGFSATENLETLDRNLDVLDAYKDVMEIKIHEAKDSLVAIAAEALMNADTDHNGIIDEDEYNNYVTIFNNKCDELLKDINEREGVSVTRGDINNLILKLTSRETNLDNLLFASVRKQLLTDKELISDPEKFKEAVENQFRNNEEKQVQLLGEYYAYLNVNGLISPAEEDYGIDINLLATYISKYISEGIDNGDINNINFEKIDKILAKDPALSRAYLGGAGGLAEKIASILRKADANNDGKLDENEKIYASQCLNDLFQFFDKDSLEGINKAVQSAVTKAMEEHPREEQLPESEKEYIMREKQKQPKIGKTYETTITTENGNEVVGTITYTGKNTYILKYTMNGIQVIDEKGSDYRSIKYSEPVKTTIGIPTTGSTDVTICKIIYKDTNGDGNISIGPQKGKVGDTAYYFTDCGETDLSKAIKIDYHYTNSGLTPSNRYYKAGDWGLTDKDKGKCYGNCYLWSNTSGQGKLYMYGSKGQIIGSCVDKDGDMQCDKDEKGNIDYKPYNTDGDMVLDSSDDDDDGDGYPDIIEVACGSSPNSAGSIPSQDCLSKVSGKRISTGSYEEGNYIIYESVKIEDCDNDGKMEKNIVKQYYNKKTGAKGKTTYTCSPLLGMKSCSVGVTVNVACRVGICRGVMKSTCVSTPYGTAWQDSGNCIVDEKCSESQGIEQEDEKDKEDKKTTTTTQSLKDKCLEICKAMGEENCEAMCAGITSTTLPSNCRRSCGACSSKGKHYCITYCNGKPVDGSGSWDPCTPTATPSTTPPTTSKYPDCEFGVEYNGKCYGGVTDTVNGKYYNCNCKYNPDCCREYFEAKDSAQSPPTTSSPPTTASPSTTTPPTTSAPSCRISCGAPGSTGKCYCMTICDGKPVDGSGHWVVCPT